MLHRLFALALLGLATACNAQPQGADFTAGTDYTVLEPAQPTNAGNKIEVLEVFGYSCPHCADLQLKVDSWRPKLPADVQVSYMPAVFGGVWEAFARAYYTAETMGVLEKSHTAIFKAVHVEKRAVRNLEDIAGLYVDFGIDKETFIATMQSFAVNAKIARAQQQVPRYGVTGTPTFIVNGKYRVEVTPEGGFDKMLKVVDFLVAKERTAKTG